MLQVAAVNAFSQTLRRYTSLNHLAQAARAVLHNSAQISQMLSDLNRVDFHNVQEQVSSYCFIQIGPPSCHCVFIRPPGCAAAIPISLLGWRTISKLRCKTKRHWNSGPSGLKA